MCNFHTVQHPAPENWGFCGVCTSPWCCASVCPFLLPCWGSGISLWLCRASATSLLASTTLQTPEPWGLQDLLGFVGNSCWWNKWCSCCVNSLVAMVALLWLQKSCVKMQRSPSAVPQAEEAPAHGLLPDSSLVTSFWGRGWMEFRGNTITAQLPQWSITGLEVMEMWLLCSSASWLLCVCVNVFSSGALSV